MAIDVEQQQIAQDKIHLAIRKKTEAIKEITDLVDQIGLESIGLEVDDIILENSTNKRYKVVSATMPLGKVIPRGRLIRANGELGAVYNVGAWWKP